MVVPQGDVDAMAAAIRRLAGDPDRARRLGEAGRQAVARRFARAAIEPRLLEIYAEVARHGAAPAMRTELSNSQRERI